MLDADVVSIGKKYHQNVQPPLKYGNADYHIPISNSDADPYHAIIEKKHVQNCYVLTDLNTTYGTYVNEHCLHNDTIRLMPGDVIQFGQDAATYEFGITNENERKQPQRTLSGKSEIESGTLQELQHKTWITPQNSTISLTGVKLSSRPGSAPTKSFGIPKRNSTPSSMLLRRRIKSVPIRLRPVKIESEAVRPTKSSLRQSKKQNWMEPEKTRISSETAPAKTVNFKNIVKNDREEPW